MIKNGKQIFMGKKFFFGNLKINKEDLETLIKFGGGEVLSK